MSVAAPAQTQITKPQAASRSKNNSLLVQRQCACGSSASAVTGSCPECQNKRLQTKLRIGASNDPLEQEADRVADHVMSSTNNPAINNAPPRIQRLSSHSGGENTSAPASVDRVIASGGRPLDPALQQDMSQRFGHDFSRVRVHSDAEAQQSARDVNAHAYTVGHNVVFGAGQYAPESHAGRRLLAHELTHVVQQNVSPGVPNFAQRTVAATSTCAANANGAPADPLAALSNIDQIAQSRALGASNVLFLESLTFNDPTFGQSDVFDAYRNWFGLPQTTTAGAWRSRFRTATFATEQEATAHEMRTLATRFQRIHGWLAGNVHYRCPGNSVFTIPGCSPERCNARTTAITCPTGSRTIVVCPSFWNIDGVEVQVEEQAGSLIHEAIHPLFHFSHHSTASVARRGRNPGCYEGFVHEIFNTGVIIVDCTPD